MQHSHKSNALGPSRTKPLCTVSRRSSRKWSRVERVARAHFCCLCQLLTHSVFIVERLSRLFSSFLVLIFQYHSSSSGQLLCPHEQSGLHCGQTRAHLSDDNVATQQQLLCAQVRHRSLSTSGTGRAGGAIGPGPMDQTSDRKLLTSTCCVYARVFASSLHRSRRLVAVVFILKIINTTKVIHSLLCYNIVY